MKTSTASLLAVLSLSLALCACDSGDKKPAGSSPDVNNAADNPGAAIRPKPTAPKENPQPPESTEPVKKMNEAPAPGAPAAEGGVEGKFPALDMINGAITTYAQQQHGKTAMDDMKKVTKMSEKDRKAQYFAAQNKKAAGSGTVTSLDQLVTAGLLPRIPEPPAGQKWVLDVKAQKVRLENQ